MFPPELLFRHRPSRKSDIYQLGILLFKIHARVFPFPSGPPSYELLLWQATRVLGPLPETWRGRFCWEKYRTLVPPPVAFPSSLLRGGAVLMGREGGEDFPGWFDQDQPTAGLGMRLRQEPHLDGCEREREGLVALLGEMLAWEPEKRPSAGSVEGRLLQLRPEGVAVDGKDGWAQHPRTERARVEQREWEERERRRRVTQLYDHF